MSGAGKTTVCKVFSDNGIAVINCDTVARNVTEKGSACLAELKTIFGEKIINPDGTMNRKVLGGMVFTDKALLEKLNTVIYPYITYNIVKQIENTDSRYILLDAPTLFESGIDFLCGSVISVVCDRESSVLRIIERDRLTREQAQSRLSSQQDVSFYREKSDYCIENNGSLAELENKAKAVLDSLILSCNTDERI